MRIYPSLSFLAALLLALAAAYAEPPAPGNIQMSSELRTLFQAEMRDLLVGTRTIAESLPTANWDAIATAAATMRDSYVLAKNLTKAQEAELSRLPEQFKVIDQAFHMRADKLVAAAKTQDAEAVSFHLSRLLDTCVSCHSAYAASRFPGFEAHHAPAHHH